MVRKHFFLLAALCVLGLMIVAGGLKLAAGAAGGHGKNGPGGAGGRGGAVLVSQTQPVMRSFVDRIDVLGAAKGRQSVTITSNTTELITAVHFADGAHVGKGQVLVDLKAQEQSADIVQAQAAVNLADLTYKRWKTLGDQGIAAKASVDQYKAAYDQAKAGLDAARSRLGDRVIRAPFSGVVGLSDVAPGALINPGGAIVSLDDTAVMRVDFTVPDRYLANLHIGLPLTARSDAYPAVTEHGRIAQIDTRVDENTHAIKARAEFPNPTGRLKPGMLLHVSVEQGQRQALAVPEAAVQFENDQAFVFVLNRRNGQLIADQQQVQTGADEGGFIEITDGLKGGEQIVADGVNRVSANQPVRLAGAGAGGGGGGRGRRGGPARG